MATLVLRSTKGSPLTSTELDNNFNNLNSAKYETGTALGTPLTGNLANCTGYTWANLSGTLNRLNLGSVTGQGQRSMFGQATLDLTGLLATTYYPVTIPISQTRTTTLRIEVGLNSGSVPSWALHQNGFAVFIEWTVNGSGYGTWNVLRTINGWTESWANVTIVGGITQMTNTSTEVIYLRGGARYYFSADADVTPTVQSASYTSISQTVAPSLTVINVPTDQGSANIGAGSLSLSGALTLNGNTILGNASTDTLNVGNGDLVKDASGRLGIGTASPTKRLDTSANSTTLIPFGAFNSNNNVDTNPTVTQTIARFERSGKDGVSYSSVADFGISRYEVSGTTARTQMDIRLSHGDVATPEVTVMTMRSNGNVGIGTTTPNYRGAGTALSIAGSTAAGGVLELVSTRADAVDNYQTIAFIANANTNKTIAQIEAFTSGATSGNRGGVLKISTKPDGAGNILERMRIEANGNLLVGTIATTGNIGSIYNSSGHALALESLPTGNAGYAGTVKRICTSLGSTADPSFGYVLLVPAYSSGALLSKSIFTGKIYAERGSQGSFNISGGVQLTVSSAYNENRFGASYFGDGECEIVTCTYAGALYIAVRNSSAWSSQTITIDGLYTDNFTPIIVADGTVSNVTVLGKYSNKDVYTRSITSTGNTILGDASTDTLNVGNGGLVKDAAGNVGIGLTNPTYKLQVNGTGYIEGSVNLGGGGGSSKLNIINTNAPIQIVNATNTNQVNFDFADAQTFTLRTYHVSGSNLTFGTTPSGGVNTERMRIDSNGSVGIGGVTLPTAVLHLKAGTAALNTAPLKFTNGVNLTTPEAGVVEYDGAVQYFTNDVRSGRGFTPTTQIFRLTAAGTAIGITAANFFGSNSAIRLLANAAYEIEAYCYFLKTTAGTVTVTPTLTVAPTNLNGTVQYGALVGGTASGTSNQINLIGSTGTATAFGTSGSLTTGVNHLFIVKLIVEAGATDSDLRLNFTSVTTGSVQPLRGSYYKTTRLPASNTGIFAA